MHVLIKCILCDSCSTRPLIQKNGISSHVVELASKSSMQFVEMFHIIHAYLGPWSSDFECIVDPILGVTRVAIVANRHGQSTISVVAKKFCA